MTGVTIGLLLMVPAVGFGVLACVVAAISGPRARAIDRWLRTDQVKAWQVALMLVPIVMAYIGLPFVLGGDR